MKRFALIASLVLLSIGPSLMAATIVAPPALRQGTFLSPSVTVPNGTTTVTISFDGIPTADYENPANSFQFSVEMSADGTTWRSVAAFGWVSPGGPFVDPKTGVTDPVNSVTYDVRPWLAAGLTLARARVVVPNAMTGGITVVTQ